MTPKHEDKKEPPCGNGNESSSPREDMEVAEEDLELATEDDLQGKRGRKGTGLK